LINYGLNKFLKKLTEMAGETNISELLKAMTPKLY